MNEKFKGVGIHAKLCYIQTHLRVPKDNEVKNWRGQTQYMFRNLAAIFEKVKPLLDETGCELRVPDDPPFVVGAEIAPVFETVKDKNGNETKRMVLGPRIYIRAHAILTDIEDGKFVEVARNARENEWRAGMDPAQLTGSTSSYAGKYAAEALFCLDGSDDPDSIAGKELPTQRPCETPKNAPANAPIDFSVCPCGKAVGTKFADMDTATLEKVLASVGKAAALKEGHADAIRAILEVRKAGKDI